MSKHPSHKTQHNKITVSKQGQQEETFSILFQGNGGNNRGFMGKKPTSASVVKPNRKPLKPRTLDGAVVSYTDSPCGTIK